MGAYEPCSRSVELHTQNLAEPHDHLLVLSNPDTLSLDDLDILEPTENVVLNHKIGFHAKFCPFFDGERFAFQRFQAPWSSEINGDVWASLDFECEGLNDTATLVLGIDGNCWG